MYSWKIKINFNAFRPNLHENVRYFGNNFDEYIIFSSEFGRAADVIVLSEAWFSVNNCHNFQGYT